MVRPVVCPEFSTYSHYLFRFLVSCRLSVTEFQLMQARRMGTVNMIVVIESIRSLATKEGDELQKFHLPSIISVAIALSKFRGLI
jgi:hypothetical protein